MDQSILKVKVMVSSKIISKIQIGTKVEFIVNKLENGKERAEILRLLK